MATIIDFHSIHGVQQFRIRSRIKANRHKLPPLGGIGHIGCDWSGHYLLIAVNRLVITCQPTGQGIAFTAPLGRSCFCGIIFVPHILHDRIKAFRLEGDRKFRCITQIQRNGGIRSAEPLLILCAICLGVCQIIRIIFPIAPNRTDVIDRNGCFRSKVSAVIYAQVIVEQVGHRPLGFVIDPECSQIRYGNFGNTVSIVIHRQCISINGIDIAISINAIQGQRL